MAKTIVANVVGKHLIDTEVRECLRASKNVQEFGEELAKREITYDGKLSLDEIYSFLHANSAQYEMWILD